MRDRVAAHYAGEPDLASKIAERLQASGIGLDDVTTTDLATVDEFHVRGRKATLELSSRMRLAGGMRVLDIGSGLGGPARTVAEASGCYVTGIDLTPAFCEAANVLSQWVGLAGQTVFEQADATDLPFDDRAFDAAMTIHVAMNIPAKDAVYGEAKRVLKPGSVFAVYDIMQGEGGDVIYPTPWARDPSLSHLATPDEVDRLLHDAGFEVVDRLDTTQESQSWFEAAAARSAAGGPPPVTFQTFLGDDFQQMMKNLVRNLTERRVRTVSFICEA